jgi:hypothetical protein
MNQGESIRGLREKYKSSVHTQRQEKFIGLGEIARMKLQQHTSPLKSLLDCLRNYRIPKNNSTPST